jgi:hypothetical protein
MKLQGGHETWSHVALDAAIVNASMSGPERKMSNDLPIPTGPVNVTFVRGDDAMIPSLIAE